MFAVIVYFWSRWVEEFFSSWMAFGEFITRLLFATIISGVVGYPLMKIIERVLAQSGDRAEIESLFSKLNWIAPALAAVGILIIYAGLREARQTKAPEPPSHTGILWPQAIVMGILQGIAIPFRGFSRSGSTISGGLLAGGSRARIESFSFAMAVAITPLAIGREALRAFKGAQLAGNAAPIGSILAPGLVGMVCAFIAGLIALRWLSSWLEQGRWHWFGAYCLVAAAAVGWLYYIGY
jgi:undecaprenyl-diphosphatase